MNLHHKITRIKVKKVLILNQFIFVYLSTFRTARAAEPYNKFNGNDEEINEFNAILN